MSQPTDIEMFCPTCGQSQPENTAVCPHDGTRLIRLGDETDPLLGKNIDGRFTLRSVLGAGGMGTVYRAFQHSLGREVAVKLIRPDHAARRDASKRFLREAQLISRLSHPNIVATLDFGQTQDNLLFLVMELLKGRTLREVLADSGRLSIERAVAITVQLTDALHHAHQAAIIHRDLKPGNILLLDGMGRDFVKVLDFGLAKSLAGDLSTVTAEGAVLGTPSYMAPEIAAGEPGSAATDLYATGVIFYEMIAGRRPTFPAAPLEPLVPQPLEKIVLRLLERDPAKRFPSAAALREVLLAFQPGGAEDTIQSDRSRVLEPPKNSRRWLSALTAAAGIAIAAGLYAARDPVAMEVAALPIEAVDAGVPAVVATEATKTTTAVSQIAAPPPKASKPLRQPKLEPKIEPEPAPVSPDAGYAPESNAIAPPAPQDLKKLELRNKGDPP